MKRWISALLIVIYSFIAVAAVSEPGLEENLLDETQDLAQTEEVCDAEPLEGVVVGLEDDTADAEAAWSLDSTENATSYARVTSGLARVCTAADESAAYVEIARDSVVLVIGQATARWTRIAFDTRKGVMTGYTLSSDLKALSADETERFMDVLSQSGTVALYEDDLDRPLAFLNCAFLKDGEHLNAPAPVEEEPDQPASDADEAAETDPAEPNNVEPDPETEESSDESAEIPVPIDVNLSAYNGLTVKTRSEIEAERASLMVPRLSTETLTIGVGEVYTGLSASGASDIIWTSSDISCASVDAATGVVTGINAGTAIITAKSNDGTSTQCTVNVVPAPTSMEISTDTSWFIGVGETYAGLKAVVNAAGGEIAAPGSVTWSSSDPGIIAVDAYSGVVTGVKAGTAKIMIRAYNGRTAACRMIVKAAPNSLALNRTELSLTDGGMHFQLFATLPAGSASANIRYSTSDASVAQVSASGLVTAVNDGTATITAETFNGISATCNVVVHPSPTTVAFDETELTLGVGQRAVVHANPTSASGGTMARLAYYIDERSADPGCVSINAITGEIVALRKGQAIIGVRTHNALTAEAPCVVTVVSAPASLYIRSGAWTIGAGEAYDGLEAVLISTEGETAVASGLTWYSGNTGILRVDAATGAVTGVSAGNASVTVKTHNGKSATCTLTVREAPGSIALNKTELTLAEGSSSAQLNVTLPEGTASAHIHYTSSDESIATVSGKGVVSPVGPGSAVITAETFNGTQAACAVTVNGLPRTVSLDHTTLTLNVSETATLNASALGSDGKAAHASFTYCIDETASEDPGCVTVNAETGEITGVRAGRAVVSARAQNGVIAAEPCLVEVFIMPTSLKLDNLFDRIGVGEQYTGLEYAIDGPEGFDASLAWTSSDPAVISVGAATSAVKGSAAIEAKAVGTATITATAINGLTASCTINVLNAPESMTLSPGDKRLYITESAQYTVSFAEGTASSYSFSVSDASVATITETGAVTGVEPGMVTVTATAANGVTATAQLTVTDAGTPNIPSGIPASVASTTNYYFPNMTNAQKLEYVIYCAQQQLGKPYVYGGGYNDSNPGGFDCSGLVYWSFKRIGITLQASAYTQGYDEGYPKISSISALKRGDVVCFNTNDSDGDLSDHTAIYLGSGYFIHAATGSTNKVVVSSLSSGYYSDQYYYSTTYGNTRGRFSWGRRILD